jgi:uncharacterized membrane protein YdjX (TVP38/TMEM64 family)
MTNKEKTVYAILILIAAAGIYLGRFFGGILTGATISMLLVMFIGKRLANKAISRIDKQVKDIIVENQR